MTNLSSSTTLASMIDRTSGTFVAGCGFLHRAAVQRVETAMYRILAGGPTSVDRRHRLGAGSRPPRSRVGRVLAGGATTIEAVTGFFGLQRRPAAGHQARRRRRMVAWTWCTLTRCSSPEGARRHRPDQLALPVARTEVRRHPPPAGSSGRAGHHGDVIPPDFASFDDIITTLCHFILVLRGRRGGTFGGQPRPRHVSWVSIQDGEIGRHATSAVFDVVLAEQPEQLWTGDPLGRTRSSLPDVTWARAVRDPRRIVLVLPTETYRAADFLRGGRRR